ncbi:MAG: hypothetical protein KC680_02540 [Candidatus Peregrinibacteria bacterium]|nr:hypothetical protein [Candidatus Peregrinibacteria bacterium]MCB9808289.1 hypothetical protein [Candidatus Peribacteria bacterium]
MAKKLQLTIGVLATMLLLGASDIIVLEGSPGYQMMAQADEVSEPVIDRTNPVEPPSTIPEGGVRKFEGPNVEKTLGMQGFSITETSEQIILDRVVTGGGDTVTSKALLLHGDRAGSIAWVSSPQVKKHYVVLKEALHSAFTPEVKDLLDETQRRENHPTRNLLTFYDPGLLPERVVFVRVRERLYEFHVAEGASDEIFNLIEDLTK